MKANDLAIIAAARDAAATGEARRLRISRRLSLADIAATCSVNASTVWRWEHGERTPRGISAVRYGGVLDLLRGMAASPRDDGNERDAS